DLYELAEELVDLEDWFQQWRFRHVTTVERIIGRKRGTGGTAGVAYLRQALDIRFFPELWEVRTELCGGFRRLRDGRATLEFRPVPAAASQHVAQPLDGVPDIDE